jgi:hypothetical protein
MYLRFVGNLKETTCLDLNDLNLCATQLTDRLALVDTVWATDAHCTYLCSLPKKWFCITRNNISLKRTYIDETWDVYHTLENIDRRNKIHNAGNTHQLQRHCWYGLDTCHNFPGQNGATCIPSSSNQPSTEIKIQSSTWFDQIWTACQCSVFVFV